ncbi:MAG TPA: FkbM family methyltransferase [Ramlibacter sp.]|nr:FkbM family methyltransferase [Ramlibacter sp.]
MTLPKRPVAYVLAATNHGSMIVNRFDYAQPPGGEGFGVGLQLLNNSCFDPEEVDLALGLLGLRHRFFGHGVVAIDGGANLGVHTLSWARHMHGWGRVIAFEAQEQVFYALAGNIALNNCWNATARWAALGERDGHIDIPEPDYLRPGSFGSLELRAKGRPEYIGQPISYEAGDCVRTPMQSIDALDLPRLDFLKLDVEGMELDVLRGARATIGRCKPIVMAEVVKSDKSALLRFVEDLGYTTITEGMGLNMLAFHASDPSRGELRRVED